MRMPITWAEPNSCRTGIGSRIVMGGPDWDSIEKSVNGYPEGKPKRDIVADDGQKITLGDTSVTLIATPGHTPGTLSMIFTVKDNGKPLTVAYSGGTAFNFPSTVANFDTYIKSQSKMAAAAAAANATILMSNHSEFDSATTKIRMLASRKPGEPHPFEIGKEAVARYFVVTGECAQAARLKLTQPLNNDRKAGVRRLRGSRSAGISPALFEG